MAYVRTNWINNETELSAENMNHIEKGIEKSYTVWLEAVTDEEPEECYTGDIYFNTTTKLLYTAIERNVWSNQGVRPETGIIYVVFDTQSTYGYNGDTLISIGGGGGGGIAVYPDEPEEDTKLYIEEEDLDGQYLPVDEDIYSTDEVKTNKVWIDGKPIYRKLYNFEMLSSAGTVDIPYNIQNIDTITNYTGIIYGYNSNIVTRPLPLCDGTTTNNIRIDTDTTDIHIKQYANWSGYTGYITLEYTKTS